ncbi:Pentatricopeptide repeat, partial [Thalictrum thalictroides]
MNFNFKYDNLKEAIKLFDEMPMRDRDVVTWTSLIVGYAQKHFYNESLIGFQRMMMEGRSNEGIIPNGYTFSSALSACSGIQAVKQGKQIHCYVLTSGLLGSNLVVYNSLLHMYWSCGYNFYAQNLFNSVSVSGNIIAWNEMMLGYLQCGQEEEALKLFVLMVSEVVVKPDNFSYAICIDACGSLASLQQGSQIHACVLKTGFQLELIIMNALVDMYAKCGCLDSAKIVFYARPSKDRVFWTTLITALGKNGKVKEVLEMFEQMRNLKIQPDGITYLVVLSACSHGGLVEQGWQYFRSMTEDDLVPVSQKHCASMVDLLCRSGYLLQAFAFIKEMPLKPGISIWSTFLGFCRMKGNIELAQFAAEKLLELSPKNTA